MPDRSTPPSPTADRSRRADVSTARAAAMFGLGVVSVALFAQTVMEDARLAAAYASEPLWRRLVDGFGAAPVPEDPLLVRLPFDGLFVLVLAGALPGLAVGGWLARRRTRTGWGEACRRWCYEGWRWWLLTGAWWAAWTASLLTGWQSAVALLAQSSELWLSIALAGWIAGWFRVRHAALRTDGSETKSLSREHDAARRDWRVLLAAVAVYGFVFTAMNWGLWFNLRVPHGDSAMYEEHLWNIEHGKGFRSYLDQGLFLGEHIQVIHLLLLPLHWVWPSHLLLEVCQAFALAAGAIPVYRLARRFGGSERAALLLGCCYLLYFPLQYLDITIDLKTFRPNSLGVPAMLFALDALERGRRGPAIAWLALMLAAQEDYAIVISLLGAWMIVQAGRQRHSAEAAPRWSLSGWLQRLRARESRGELLFGAGLFAFGIAYLLLTFKVVFPYFREGATIHYASYFARFGSTPEEIAWTIFTRPHRVLAELLTVDAALYAAALLVPLGGLPLCAPGRLLVAAPLFGLLCLNELALQPPAPVHHFHAPLVPLLFWAAAAGLSAPPLSLRKSQSARAPDPDAAVRRARIACLCAALSGLFLSITPLSLKFWDPGSSRYWRALYVPNERARLFRHVDALIPQEARVASTDFVHARLTHRERSYDYSDYLRKVSGYEARVPHDTDYIVIDIEHPYHRPEQVMALRRDPYAAVRELRTQPERWELVKHPADAYFVVLRRRAGD